jgi:hypothetical protein
MAEDWSPFQSNPHPTTSPTEQASVCFPDPTLPNEQQALRLFAGALPGLPYPYEQEQNTRLQMRRTVNAF